MLTYFHIIRSLIVLVLATITYQAAGQAKYFVEFCDKKGTGYSISSPNKFLSEKSIERRAKQGMSITQSDLPVSERYVNQISRLGAKIHFTSKWLNGAVCEIHDSQTLNRIRRKRFVKGIEMVFDPNVRNTITPDFSTYNAYTAPTDTTNFYNYGSGYKQISMLNGHKLHNLGFRGSGITIAILDGGFLKADILSAFDSLWLNNRIIFEDDVVNSSSDIYQENSHGMFVLSILGSNISGMLVGTAPEANYALIRCEDTNSEQVIEEYYWTVAAEIADSIGADIINSSLGYYDYDANWQDLTYAQLNGTTCPITKAANLATEKGMLVIASAGNEATTDWKHINAPADALNCIAVGSVDENGNVSSFSSIGPTYDGRTKPDLVALGENTTIQTTTGEIGTSDGTSLSAPIIAGLAACLWQARPNLTANELADIIRKSGNLYNTPNNRLGFGTPDFLKALQISKETKK